jgi:exodeoxyribonuclease (lambda-induced)
MRDFKKEMELHSETLGFDLSKVEQGSPDWHRSRAGCISASKAYYLLMKRGTEGRQTYLNELVASIATGLLPEEIKAKPLQWGKDNEDDAREAYSAATFESVEDVAFIYRDELMRAGCSPDGLITGQQKGLELKSPWSSAVFIAFAAAGTIKKEEVVQCQFSMWVTGYHSWAFAKFDPRNVNCKKLHHVVVERDEEMMEKIESGYNDFIEDMDEMLKNLGLEFGMQW